MFAVLSIDRQISCGDFFVRHTEPIAIQSYPNVSCSSKRGVRNFGTH